MEYQYPDRNAASDGPLSDKEKSMSIILWNRNNGSTLRLRVQEDTALGQTFIFEGQDRYDSLHALAAAFPELVDEPHRETYCELCTQFHGGQRYRRIDDPDAFRTLYRELLAHGETHSGELPTVADFGPFDVTEIAAPRINNGMLVFYVKDVRFGIPYRVEAPWPAEVGAAVRFALLPLVE